jgi:hypothetical protein
MIDQLHQTSRDYLRQRLDGARDLYLLALRLGERDERRDAFGPLIREARIHFVAVIEEARMAGLDTSAISDILGHETAELGDGIRAELWERLEAILPRHPAR